MALCTILFQTNVLFAQLPLREIPHPNYILFALYGSFGPNLSNTHIDEFAAHEFCGTFQNGSAPGISFGARSEFPVSASRFSILAGIGYHDLSSRFKTQPFALERAFDVASSEPVPIQRERIYTTTVSSLSLMIGAVWHPIERLRFEIGPSAGFILQHHYTKEEHLVTPDVVYTSNNLSTLELENGAFDAEKVIFSVESGIGYDFPLSMAMAFTPELRLNIPITPISSSGSSSYRTWSVSAGAGISFKFFSSEEPAVPPPPPPPIIPSDKPVVTKEPEKSVLRVEVKAVGISETGEEVPEPVVSIQNVRVTDVSPTLGFVFFEDGSADIPDRYNRFSEQKDVRGYQTNSFFKLDALGLHYEVLNIIGKRLQGEGASKITLTGTRSNRSQGDSLAKENTALERSQSVSKYLQDVWGISPSRIRIKSRGLPEQASDESTNTGQAENRRVEISSLDPKLLEPIEVRRIERTASPPRISFNSSIVSTEGVKSVNITIMQGGKVLEQINGLTNERSREWLWNIPSENIVAGAGDTVTWTMDIIDSAGHTAETSGKINIRREERTIDLVRRDTVVDKSLERFQLLLFDYSKTSSSHDFNVNMLLDRVAESVTPDSRISLIGYTDVTGDQNYNDRLSLDRATKASMLLSSKLRQSGLRSPQFSLEGRGSRELLYDNTNPEGRFLSRTVRISIEKDLK